MKVNSMKFLRHFFGWCLTPDHLSIAEAELAEAQVKLMEAEGQRQYGEAMAAFYQARINSYKTLLVGQQSTASFSQGGDRL